MENLEKIAQQLVAPGKGILAADESVKTMAKRLEGIKVEATPANRFLWREVMFNTNGIESYISGVILFDETFRELQIKGKKLADFLQTKNILAGIKVDGGTVDLPNFKGESFTQGLDNLGKKLIEYKDMGASFTKWRATYFVSETTPSKAVITANSIALAQYALLAQNAGLVPIVEPEVLVLAGKHSIEKSLEVTQQVLEDVFYWQKQFKVHLKGILLKPNMVLAGKECEKQVEAEEIAQKTVETLLKTVPEEVPGVVFLSGGLTPDQSTQYLALMNKMYLGKLPWQLSYSYGRALQQEALQAWGGQANNILNAQKVFTERAKKVSEARFG